MQQQRQQQQHSMTMTMTNVASRLLLPLSAAIVFYYNYDRNVAGWEGGWWQSGARWQVRETGCNSNNNCNNNKYYTYI